MTPLEIDPMLLSASAHCNEHSHCEAMVIRVRPRFFDQVGHETINLFTTSESPKIRIRIDQIFCYDFF